MAVLASSLGCSRAGFPFGAGDGGSASGGDGATPRDGTIPDTPLAPEVTRVSLALASQDLDEAVGQVLPRVVLDRISDHDVQVDLVLGGTTTAQDHDLLAQRVTVPVGLLELTMPFAVHDDGTHEPDEVLVLSLQSPAGAVLGDPATLVITLRDNDPAPLVAFTSASSTVEEGQGDVAIRLSLSHPSQDPVHVFLATAGSAGLADFNLVDGRVELAPGSSVTTVHVALLDDLVYESDETLTVAIEVVVGGLPDPARRMFTLHIIDDDLVPPQVSVGHAHSCAVVNDAVSCWGDNGNWQLGVGELPGLVDNSSQAVAALLPAGLATSVAAGGSHSCGVVQGAALCWGSDYQGQLGTTAPGPEVFTVDGLDQNVSMIAAGEETTCAVVGGAAWCWGANNDDVLGSGAGAVEHLPVAIPGLSSGVRFIAVSTTHACAIVDDGLQCWGNNYFGQLGDGSTAASDTPVPVSGMDSGVTWVSVEHAHSCAVRRGAALCWGASDCWENGDGSGNDHHAPVQVRGLDTGVTVVSTGVDHACAVVNGGVRCWGCGSYGRLGTGSEDDAPQAVQVPGLGDGSGVLDVAAGDRHSCALLQSGEVRCWGFATDGQLGNGVVIFEPAPVAVTSLGSGVASVHAGPASRHACAIQAGAALCWGSNDDGQLGDGTTHIRSSPAQVSGLSSGVLDVAPGGYHTCALHNDAVRCWGYNGYGQLGTGGRDDALVPVAPVGLDANVLALTTGYKHSCAVVDLGGATEVRCWGANWADQVGAGAAQAQTTPYRIAGLPADVHLVAAGELHSCAASASGVWCWGDNDMGQLGDGTRISQGTPVAVQGLPGSGTVQHLSAGRLFTCATVDGDLYCWGENWAGQLGPLGPRVLVATPSSQLLEPVIGLDTGGGHLCALLATGLVCQGRNDLGQLGDGTAQTSSTPVAVQGLVATSISSLATGYEHSCAVSSGAVWCWGSHWTGELGDGSAVFFESPQQVQGL